MKSKHITILGIESSCDDTAASIIRDGVLLSNVMAGQKVHELYGGVVPELASRAHQQNIVPVVDVALKNVKITLDEIDAIAFTSGPGLLGSLLVGTSYAKALSLALDKPLIEVNHMQGHILAHFIQMPDKNNELPSFPFLCLTVSGGHTQLVLVKDYFQMEVLGQTIDDAAGEAFDKVAKLLGLPYPGGPLVDKLAQEGNNKAYSFPHPNVEGFNFSFSGLKTSVMYFLKKEMEKNPAFIEEKKKDVCASVQKTIVDILVSKLEKAVAETGVKEIALAGGVSANSALRIAFLESGNKLGIKPFIPEFQFCTDNAAMIAICGYYHYLNHNFAPLSITPKARMPF